MPNVVDSSLQVIRGCPSAPPPPSTGELARVGSCWLRVGRGSLEDSGHDGCAQGLHYSICKMGVELSLGLSSSVPGGWVSCLKAPCRDRMGPSLPT